MTKQQWNKVAIRGCTLNVYLIYIRILYQFGNGWTSSVSVNSSNTYRKRIQAKFCRQPRGLKTTMERENHLFKKLLTKWDNPPSMK